MCITHVIVLYLDSDLPCTFMLFGIFLKDLCYYSFFPSFCVRIVQLSLVSFVVISLHVYGGQRFYTFVLMNLRSWLTHFATKKKSS